MNAYVKGNLVRLSGLYTNDVGTVIDPSVVKVSVLEPGELPVTYQYGVDDGVVKDSTGNYHLDIDAETEGVWRYRWYSTGTGQAANESAFEIAVSPF